MNPDPYVVCDPEVDIDKAQEQEDANYFDEDDLGTVNQLIVGMKSLEDYIFFLIYLIYIHSLSISVQQSVSY